MSRVTIAMLGLAAIGAASPALAQLAPPSGGGQQQPQMPEYPKFYELDADGMPIAPASWVDLAALTVNPTLQADQREAIEAGVREWLAGVQQLVIENPDLALEAAKGLFEDIEIEDRASLAYASEIMKAMATTGNLTAYLTTQGVISNEQGEYNRQIVQQYGRAKSEALARQVMAEAPEDQQRQMQILMARTTMTNLTDDAVRMFRSVAVRGASQARAAVEASGLDVSNFSAQLDAVKQAGTDEAKLQAMIALMDAMEPTDLFKFSKALGEKLPTIKLPEMAKIGAATQSESNGG
ncbi:MAG: hypothetical protein ACIAQU_01485 [Phycisphaerales bacterium JB064]